MRLPTTPLILALAFLIVCPFGLGAAAGQGPTARPAGVLVPHVRPSPSLATCPTPASAGIWGSAGGFFGSISVSFYVPGDQSLSGSNFNTIPCTNTIPTYVNGFFMNISTNTPIASAYVTIWGLTWSLPNQAVTEPISGYSPGSPYAGSPNLVPLYVEPPTYQTASVYFNDYKNFWPGDTVWFNLTVNAFNVTPTNISSASDGQASAPLPAGTNDVATWEFGVQSPWSSNNFTQDIAVSTTPNVFANPPFDPNRDQGVSITLTALNLGDGTTLSIPEAELYLEVYTGGIDTANFQIPFGPANHSSETLIDSTTQLPRDVGPFAPGSEIQFNVTAWVPWEGGAIDRLYSPVFTFNASTLGGWWAPHAPLESNLNLTTDPAGLSGTPLSLQTMTPVNVTIHEAYENVTLGASEVKFAYRDRYGYVDGATNLSAINQNTSYVLLPGLPPGGNLTFSVLARDINNVTISSANYSYYEGGTPFVVPPVNEGYLFFEAVDLSTGQLAPDLSFQVSNATWSERAHGTPLGFAGVYPPAGIGYLPLGYDDYAITVSAFGAVESAVVHLNRSVEGPIVFYFTTAPLPALNAVNAETFPLAATVGIFAAAVAVVPIRDWFKERRRKAEAEQKRISL